MGASCSADANATTSPTARHATTASGKPASSAPPTRAASIDGESASVASLDAKSNIKPAAAADMPPLGVTVAGPSTMERRERRVTAAMAGSNDGDASSRSQSAKGPADPPHTAQPSPEGSASRNPMPHPEDHPPAAGDTTATDAEDDGAARADAVTDEKAEKRSQKKQRYSDPASLELELSTFRQEVASAVVETATMLADMRSEVRKLAKENAELRAWKAEQERSAARQKQDVELLHKAVRELADTQLSTHGEVTALRKDIAALKEDHSFTNQLAHSAVANADAAEKEVRDVRLGLLNHEQATSRMATDVATMEAALRSSQREQSTIQQELRGARADLSVLQRRFERFRDEALFSGRVTSVS